MLIKRISPLPSYEIVIPRMGTFIVCPYCKPKMTTRMGWVINGEVQLECWKGHRYPPTPDVIAGIVMCS